jgi:hypothetical protein
MRHTHQTCGLMHGDELRGVTRAGQAAVHGAAPGTAGSEGLPDGAALQQYGAVALFVECARASACWGICRVMARRGASSSCLALAMRIVLVPL